MGQSISSCKYVSDVLRHVLFAVIGVIHIGSLSPLSVTVNRIGIECFTSNKEKRHLIKNVNARKQLVFEFDFAGS